MPQVGFGTALAAARRSGELRINPFGAFNFHLEIDGVIVGGFSEISGLDIETEVEHFREGGRNDFRYSFIKHSSHPDLVLSRGMSDTDQLYGWYVDVTQGKIRRKSGTIYLVDNVGAPITWWDFEDAVPVKWEGPSLNANSGAIATEKLSLAHHGLRRSRAAQAFSAIRGLTGGGL